jgi:hypothetical protein
MIEDIMQAEQAIQKILSELAELLPAGARIDEVRVDTRNFANLATEIFVECK